MNTQTLNISLGYKNMMNKDELKRMSSEELYKLRYTVETLLKDIYDEEYRRNILAKQHIECAQKALENSIDILTEVKYEY